MKEGQGSHFRDLDGNDYIDHNLCFGALMAGHCHPAVMKAVEKRLSTGTMFGMPHDMEWQLAEEICKRFPVEMVRFRLKRNRSHHARRSSWRAPPPGATRSQV